MRTQRTQKTEKLRQEALVAERASGACMLCAKPVIKSFKHWKIVGNDFPYDRIVDLHHMILPIRHIVESELTPEELAELLELKSGYLNTVYDGMWEPTPKDKSIPGHHHLHLLVFKTIFLNE